MGTMSTFKAVIFILRSLIETFQFLTGAIEAHKYHASMDAMKESITKATTGELSDRIEGGQEVEDRFNQNTRD